MPCFGTLSFLLLFFHFLGPSMMNNFFFVALCSMRFIFYNGERCVFYGYENHARDMPRDGIVIDYYVIPGNTAAFYQFTASFIFLCFSFNISHSLYNIKSLLIFLLWFSVKSFRTVTAVGFVCSSRVFTVRTHWFEHFLTLNTGTNCAHCCCCIWTTFFVIIFCYLVIGRNLFNLSARQKHVVT